MFPLSTTKIHSGPQWQQAGGSIPDVRARPVFHAEFGKYLKGLREQKGWTMRQAEAIAQQKGFPTVTRQILLRLERGQVKTPEPDVLRSVAGLYGIDYAPLAVRFAEIRYGIVIGGSDLVRHSDQESSLPAQSQAQRKGKLDGAGGGAAQARIQQLEKALKDRDATIRATQQIARQLFTLVLPTEGRTTRKEKSAGSKADRAAS